MILNFGHFPLWAPVSGIGILECSCFVEKKQLITTELLTAVATTRSMA